MNKTLFFVSLGFLAFTSSGLSMAGSHDVRRHVAGKAPDDSASTSLLLAEDSRKRDDHGNREEANDHRQPTKGVRQEPAVDTGMQAVPTDAGPGQPGYGWLYFSNPAARRAVVISPEGEYFFNQGHGLRLVTTTTPRR